MVYSVKVKPQKLYIVLIKKTEQKGDYSCNVVLVSLDGLYGVVIDKGNYSG